MKLYPEQLSNHLQKNLAPLYLISGDEPLLVTEAADAIRAKAKENEFHEREILQVEARFDWSNLAACANTLSLFSDKCLIELRLPSGKPGDAGSKALKAYVEQLPADKLLLIISGKLDSSAQKTKWFKALEQAGVFIPVWPIETKRMPAWLKQRMQQAGLSTSPEGLQLLTEHVEGNLLAASQEIEKLLLLHGPGQLDTQAIAQAVTDNSHFDLFSLADTALAGETQRVIKILQGFKAEGQEPAVILWALARECRLLAAMAYQLSQGKNRAQLFKQHRVWEKRQGIIGRALQQHDAIYWQQCLQQAAHIDQIIKGAVADNVWDALTDLALRLAGVTRAAIN